MTEESLSKIVEQSLNSVDLKKLEEIKDGSTKDKTFALLKLLSGDVVGAVESEMQAITDYKEGEFFRKYVRFLYELVDVTAEERHKFIEEVQEKAEDYSGNVIFGIVDRMDNINKEQILARLTVAKIHSWISIEEFFRLSSMLERIPYVDLKLLPKYKEPYYDESGDTELLFATGALQLNTLDADGPNLYILSTLGEKLLLYGLGINLNIRRDQGTKVEVPAISMEKVDELVNKKVETAVPKVVNQALEWEEIK